MLVTNTWYWIFVGLLELACLLLALRRALLLARRFVQDQVSARSCDAEYYSLSSAVKVFEYV
jgi:hypothetical protein